MISDAIELSDTSPSGLVWKQHPTNPKLNGTPALACLRKDGYFFGQYARTKLYAHRVIYELHHGVTPDKIDHIDGNPSNNCISNLRSVTHAQNMRNTPKAKGFRWRDGAWQVELRLNNVRYTVGRFKDILTARAEYLRAKRSMHPEAAINLWS